MKKTQSLKKRGINTISPAANLIISIILTIMALGFVMPIVLVVCVSLSDAEAIAFNGYKFIPETWSLAAYDYLLKIGGNLWRSYGMTIFYTFTGTVLSLFVMSMFAYVLARKDFKARMPLAFFTFFTTLFNGGLVPSYILFTRYLHIDDTIWVFLLPGMVGAFNVIILRTFVTSTIPDSLIESAKLDGASEWQVYLKIVMPLFKAGLATIGLFNVVGRWNDWFTGLMYIKDRKLVPVMTFLQRIQKNIEFLKSGSPEAATPEGMQLLKSLPGETARMAITVIVTLPLLVAYPFFQKYFIKGLTIGSVKG